MQIESNRYNRTAVKHLLPATMLIALLVSFSWAAPLLQSLLPGFSPLPPLFFCIAACMSTRWVWLAATYWIGTLLRQRSWFLLIGGSLGAALAFYLVTNTGTWALSGQYAKTWAGWIQCQTTGLPGYAPAWMFLKGQLAASVLFTPLFLLGQGHFRRPEQEIIKPATTSRACRG